MSDNREPEQLVDGKSFDEWVAEAEVYTTHDTAVEIARSEFGMGGDLILEPEDSDDD